jgi:hypothetical protein
MDEALTGIHVTKEKSSVFTDPKMLDAFVYQWIYFAGRYKGIPSEKLSFNLVNEPIVTPAPAQMEELKEAGKLKPEGLLQPRIRAEPRGRLHPRCPRGHRTDYKP